ncbi:MULTISPECIES: GspK family T2SS minor pseudopilin variant XcpX [Pseudomonas]|uniref:GspK family T2SS minor pseudopilin variant XcpX n=1 Tax=Pseudomonas TaxID=286 RepID=UPI000997CDBD|nr:MULTISPECIES: GspK family T2SS minor pseudopilin variant XcpX [Pseudomonas]MBM2562115.1 GspK family T2SS minor pseudopilin variant XcpX [Pseudomonas sp. AF1]MBM2583912.1 GspK family T2SS minor pseudopilin variant XcpX [Pseudomonas sp. AFW1]MBM2589709.1 GspK family T2SS minor pseudopilin variant XcpX [Pseudomonas sp. BIS]MBM2607027.1 GspK family T2SS minor pseudopilin variant XcpX [Pseudomonas sp. BIS1]MCT5794573.1 GspK family T2SS minor pseudopilin variant XcpX [Pseudomonas aeruginosa]
MRRGQNGVALITVLLVVAVVTIVCAGLIIRQQLAIRSSANQLHVRQAWHYALGGERLAEAVLRRDLRQGGENTREPVDHLGEAWARPMTPFKLDDGGELRVRIEDPSGRFNLNGLVRKRKVKPDSVKQFRRLLATLGMKEEIVQGLPDRLADWLDADQNPQGERGAEDNQYLLEAPAYRAANRSFKDVSELRLLKLSEADYRRLLPFVSALPEDAPLNVNTASVPVLAAMFEIDPGQAENIVDARGREGFQSKDDFTKHLTQLGSKTGNVSYAVGTRYFQVISEVSLGDRRQVLVSTLQRGKDGKIRVMARDMGQGGLPIPSTGGDDWKKDER